MACDASGYDDVLPAVPKHERPKPYEPGKVAGGKGRAKAGRLKVKAKARGKGKGKRAEVLVAVAG